MARDGRRAICPVGSTPPRTRTSGIAPIGEYIGATVFSPAGAASSNLPIDKVASRMPRETPCQAAFASAIVAPSLSILPPMGKSFSPWKGSARTLSCPGRRPVNPVRMAFPDASSAGAKPDATPRNRAAISPNCTTFPPARPVMARDAPIIAATGVSRKPFSADRIMLPIT